eukprot:334059_1
MSFEINTHSVLKLSEKNREKGVNLIIKICKNILQHPENIKYQSLNFQKLYKKLKYECFIDVLLQCGFYKSKDAQKLIFDVKQLYKLKILNNWLMNLKQPILSINKNKTININDDKKCSYDSNNIRQLMDAGLTEQESIEAIQLSLDSNLDNNSHTDISTEISELINMGCSRKEAIEAIKLSMRDFDKHNSKIEKHKNMDIDEAEKYLVSIGYKSADTMKAFVAAKYDIDIAVNYLKNGYTNINANKQSFAKTKSESKSIPNASVVTSMTEMGFSEQQSISALQFCGGNLNMAIESIVQGDCYGLIKECKCLLRVVPTIKKYIATGGKNNFQDEHKFDVQKILNDFNHLLIEHESSADFEHIYQCFGQCDIKLCAQMRRHHRDRELANDKQNVSLLCEVIDKIHCYFVHCYDIGMRLTPTERQKLTQNIDSKAEHDNDNKYLYTNIINSKKHLHQRFTNSKLLNKFHQMRHNINYDVYRFGQQFYYWDYFRHCDVEDVCTPGYRYYHWCVSPKHKTLKQELTDNNIARISYGQWNNEYRKASLYRAMHYCRKIISEIQQHPHPHLNTEKFGIANGEQISINHLISIIIYCSYSHLSAKFSETFRRLKKTNDTKQEEEVKLNDISSLRNINCAVENDNSLKQRNSNFYFLSKYINEAVNIYSKQSKDVDMMRFYHGIDKEMIFNSMKGFMYQPLSTTSVYEVAINFSMNSGMVVEINCHPNSRYFDCAWISDYPSERELLFISCGQPLIFVNITNVLNAQDLRVFIKAISIIEWSMSEHLLSSDNFEVYRNMVEQEKKQQMYRLPSYNPKLHGAKIIDPTVQLTVVKLIKHEMNRYEPTKYDKYIAIPHYIDKLLHNICIQKTEITINWKWMNIEMTNEYMFNKNGYLGYLFLKNVFFENISPIVNLDLIGILFPNLKLIELLEIPNFTTTYLNDVLRYLSSNRSKHLRSIGLCFDNQTTNQLTDFSFFSHYKFKFLNIGWDIMYRINQGSISMFNMKYFTADRAMFRNPGDL